MAASAARGEPREENRKLAKILVGVMVLLVVISIVTILVKH